tara:strand:- start:2442 stop:3104 length:663 start_codon:yes stop_codon:yes gene_type:complete
MEISTNSNVLEQQSGSMSFTQVFTEITNNTYEKKKKRNIWDDSHWKHIAELENDDVGKVGEQTIQKFCEISNITSSIDGLKTKEKESGGKGDGTINNKSVEIKTARLGSTGSSFQHELGECPWNADFMLFLDIEPKKMYITLFPNFSEDFYKKSGCDTDVKCEPYFPSKSICWRKQKGAFKLDTTIKINENNKYTFIIDENNFDKQKFYTFINSIIPLGP